MSQSTFLVYLLLDTLGHFGNRLKRDTYENDDQRISKTAKKIKTISREQLPAALNVALFMES